MGAYAIKFSKIHNNHNELRDNEIEGRTFKLPVIGESFVLYAKSRDLEHPDAFRMVNTSPLTSVDKTFKGIFIVSTESGSRYKIEFVG